MIIDERLINLAQQQPYPLVFATISGAHLYGFPSPDSDYDLRGAHLLPLREVIGLDDPLQTILSNQVIDGIEFDIVTHDLRKFIDLLLDKNGNMLEQIVSPLIVQTSPAHDRIKALLRQCVTRYHAYHYLGFARKKWELLNKESPWSAKPLLYVYRVLLSGIHLMRSGEVVPNLVDLNTIFELPYIPDLIARKMEGAEKGYLPDADHALHQREYERLIADLEAAKDTTHLPEKATCKAELNDLLVDLRLATLG